MKIFFGTTCILVFFNINQFTGTCDLIKKISLRNWLKFTNVFTFSLDLCILRFSNYNIDIKWHGVLSVRVKSKYDYIYLIFMHSVNCSII